MLCGNHATEPQGVPARSGSAALATMWAFGALVSWRSLVHCGSCSARNDLRRSLDNAFVQMTTIFPEASAQVASKFQISRCRNKFGTLRIADSRFVETLVVGRALLSRRIGSTVSLGFCIVTAGWSS